ncbi:MAG: Rrf2 family transcriptional regulator, partial [Actinomycetota bacterium]
HKAGIVESTRGATGGAMLARDPDAIRVSEVIEVFEGGTAPMFCLDEEDDQCVQTQHCGLQHLWMDVENAVRSVLEQTTIADLRERHRELQPLLWPVSIARSE